jgi:hypothetical protein
MHTPWRAPLKNHSTEFRDMPRSWVLGPQEINLPTHHPSIRQGWQTGKGVCGKSRANSHTVVKDTSLDSVDSVSSGFLRHNPLCGRAGRA